MSQRVPKRPVNKYDGKTYIDCEHDLPIRHIKKRGKWIPYVSCLFYHIIILTFIIGLFKAKPY
jgi:hypothetical protein